MQISKDAYKLVSFIKSNNHSFKQVKKRELYCHMGATITDSILQAGLNYKHVVYPRVLELFTKYKDFRTTCDFIILMQTIPLTKLINWKNEQKLLRIVDLTWFFYNNKIENENQLSLWLNNSENVQKINKIKGIGSKTVDYLKMLSGCEAIPIDRHLFKFLEFAGVKYNSYDKASMIYSKTADILGISKYELDRKIWLYMSNNQYN